MASIVVIEKDPVTRERITRELLELGYSVGDQPDGELPVLPRLRPQSPSVSVGGISIDTRAYRVAIDNQPISLTPREYQLLLFLLSNPDRVFSREQLLDYVWDQESAVGLRTVDVHIRRLRHVLEPFGYDRYLQTARGAGYRCSVTEL